MKNTTKLALATLSLAIPSSHAALTSGLVAYLDFEDLENAPEASGPDGSVSGTIVGTGIAGGQVGSASEFDGGTGDFINMPISFGAGATDLGQNFTIGAWYNLDTAPSSATGRFFVFESSDNFDISYGLRNFSDLDGLADTQSFTDGGDNTLYADEHVTGTWQHVMQTISLSGGTTTIETFINGAPRGTITSGGTIASSGINIGNARDSATNRAFDGKIDEFGAWDRILTQDEITGAYNLGLSGQALTIPEPSSILLCGLVGLGAFVRRRS